MSFDFKIDWATHEQAKYACKKWHYSGVTPKSKLVKIGVWENGSFIGVVIFGAGATRYLCKRYGLLPEQGCELLRVALSEHKVPVSKIISISLKILKKNFTGLRLVVSFADPEMGHMGTIYQAGGWVYSGKSLASKEYIYKGKRWQGRSFRNSFGGMEKSPLVRVVMGSSKYRYLMPLDKNMGEIISRLSLPYPKRSKQAMAGHHLAQRRGSADLDAPKEATLDGEEITFSQAAEAVAAS